ncbi:extracellular tyrosine-protein kinase PKDCC-like [Argiope bruennichi]|uniref:extracellular tyrosine-protein kinase PKDCC-like n=1 Tax=Argiope bruennichi TaxID=94029 RepID=UPI002494102A|nr:extracellular tyrosine-protein kinase PKDCC-like [Argiope bruennichi]
MFRLPIRKQTSASGCATILKISFGCFIFTNLLLFYYLVDHYQRPDCLRTGTCRANNKPRTLPREQWGQTIYFNILYEHFTRENNEWRLIKASSSNSTKYDNELNCSSLRKFEKVRFVAAGYTKSTYKVRLNNRTLSLKTVNIEGHDMSICLHQQDRYLYDCFLLAASKLLKEIAILKNIEHSNIVKILGYCIPADPDISDPRHTVAIFEEYGEPIDVIKLLQLSWEDRLRISLGLSRLLKHLSSFKEPIALNDFRRQQFIVIDGEPKLIDVDDIGLQEQRCHDKPCCLIPPSSNISICVPCVDQVCHGFNEKVNIIRTGRHFIKHILPHGAPAPLNSIADKITSAFQLASLDTNSIWKKMEDLAVIYKSGQYRNISKIRYLTAYKAYYHRDVSAKFDYRCQLTVSGYGCMTSVLDAEEAAEICWNDSKCKAFIFTDIKTWTGRRIAKFKSGFGNLLHNNKTTLFLKL